MDKKEYKAVKDAWARAVNNEDYKPYKDKKYGTKYEGKLNALHYMVYNIIRGFPTTRGFEPLGTGYEETICLLEHYLRFEHSDKLLFPFENLVTVDTFKELVKWPLTYI